jgi:AcrR family transcriptional regulator
MAVGISREAYLETGLRILSDQGYGGLKLAEVCHRLGVTTGSFYHYFSSWPTYSRELVSYWMHARTTTVVDDLRAEPDPRRRIDRLVQQGLTLPHSAEAAIRVWSSVDPEVHQVQLAVDQQRFDVMYESSFELLGSKRQAQLFATWGMCLLVGYEQATLTLDDAGLEWIAAQLVDALDSGRFATVPDDDGTS